MNINKINNLNFNAHFKDNSVYWQLREHFMNMGITHEQVKDCDEFLLTQPDAEVVIDSIDDDNHKTYIFGNINMPYGKNKKFTFEDYKTPDFIYSLRDMITDIVNNVNEK